MVAWNIHRKDECCSRCEKVFEEGEAHFSVLSFSAEGLARDDRCQACFPGDGDDAEGEDLIFWRTRRRPKAKKGLAVDFEAVESLFLALESREEETLRELRYLLSLLLMRKRRLKLIRVQRRPDGEVMVVRRPRRKEELSVFVHDLTPERTEDLRGQLEGLFEGAEIDDLVAGGAESPAHETAPAGASGDGIAPHPPEGAEKADSEG